VPDRDASTGGLDRLPDDDAITLAEGSMTVWANPLTLMATHLREHGMPHCEVLEMLTMLHDTNEATIRSPRAKASAASHLMAVFKAFETT
jgi:hypothetical protein